MNVVQAVYLTASIVFGVAIAGMLRQHRVAGSSRSLLGLSLAILIVSLLAVGVVSQTFIRHIVQVVPPLVALAVVIKGSPHGPAAAAPILTFWLGVMFNIWMFLLGIARIFTGTFTTPEIALTIIMAIACIVGLAAIARSGSRLTAAKRIVTAVAFGIFQFIALIASFQPVFR